MNLFYGAKKIGSKHRRATRRRAHPGQAGPGEESASTQQNHLVQDPVNWGKLLRPAEGFGCSEPCVGGADLTERFLDE